MYTFKASLDVLVLGWHFVSSFSILLCLSFLFLSEPFFSSLSLSLVILISFYDILHSPLSLSLPLSCLFLYFSVFDSLCVCRYLFDTSSLSLALFSLLSIYCFLLSLCRSLFNDCHFCSSHLFFCLCFSSLSLNHVLALMSFLLFVPR